MSNNLKKEFKHSDVERMRNIIKKDYTGKTKLQSGYKKTYKKYKEGDIWEESGKNWTIKNGLKQNITKLDAAKQAIQVPLTCPKCGKAIKSHISKEAYKVNKMCFDCVIDWQAELREKGMLEDYLMHARKGNLKYYINEIEAQLKDTLEQTNDYVTEQGDIENWNSSKQKEKAIVTEKVNEYIDYLKKKLN